MNRVARRRGVEQYRCRRNDLRFGDRAADGTWPRGATMTRHCHVGGPIFLGRGIKRCDLWCRWHPEVPAGPQPRHVRMGAPHDPPQRCRIERRQLR